MSRFGKLLIGLMIAVPTSLQAAPPAMAGVLKDLLERVEALESTVTESGGLVVKANGEAIGLHIEGGVAFDPLSLLNSEGYIVRISTFESEFTAGAVEGRVYPITVCFTSENCVGEPFASVGKGNVRRNTGIVFRSGFEGEPLLYYVLGNSQLQKIDTLSYYTFDLFHGVGCWNYSEPSEQEVSPAYPNDPSITGVYNDTYPAPITFGQ